MQPGMNRSDPDVQKEPRPTADGQNAEGAGPPQEQNRTCDAELCVLRTCSLCTLTEDQSPAGCRSQSSLCRSLQRAELLLRNTFSPSLKWLLHDPSQDEEENFVLAHNLVSRSSVRLQRLQLTLLTLAPQWQLVGGAQMGPPQACGRRPSSEGVVFHLLPSCHLPDRYSALWKLLEQRELLLFVHEYTRRLRLMTAYTSRVQHLLEHQSQELNLSPNRNFLDSALSWVGLCSLSQELRVHLSHWACLSSRVQSSYCLRRAMARHSRMLQAVRESLDLLGLQVLVLMERYIHALLCTVAGSDSVPEEVLEDVLRGIELYNLAVEEHSVQHSALLQWTVVLQQAHYSSPFASPLPHTRRSWPGPVPVERLLTIMAAYQADRAAEQLHHWISQQSCPVQTVLSEKCANLEPRVCCGVSAQTRKWTWKQLQNSFIISPSSPVREQRSGSLHDGDAEGSFVENPGSVWPTCNSFKPGEECTIQNGSNLTRRDSDLHLERPSAQLLCQVLLSSSDLLPPPLPHSPPAAEPTEQVLAASGESNCRSELESTDKDKRREDLQKRRGQNHGVEETGPDRTELDPTNRDVREENVESRGVRGRAGARWPHSVQWLDLSGPLRLAELLGRYRSLLWTLCRRALWLKLHVPEGAPEASFNLYDDLTTFVVLDRISEAAHTGLLPDEYQGLLEELGLRVKVLCAHAHWNHGVCRTLCSSLKDKCVPHESSSGGAPSSEDRQNLSQTMESFLLLPPSLLWSLACPPTGLQVSGGGDLTPHRTELQSRTVAMVLASVQLSTVWVVSKAFQFLSSWSLNKFLLITQGDLELLMESVEEILQQLLRLDVDRQPFLCGRRLRQQLLVLKEAASELQVFSSLVLKTFSVACKQMSGEIFEQTMPSAGHWRPSKLTGFPSNPSTYAALAAQTVIGQVLEGVAQLPDDAQVRALSVTMTAFMEAWMEHILKERIKFSVQGALQLKRDFDSVRHMIQSECYGLSAELLQRLLSLRVFQQVDSVVLCLLQQPQDKASLKSSSWGPLTRCCPTTSRDSIDAVAAGHITNLGFLDGEEPNQSDTSVLNSDLLAVDPPSPAEPYLAPSMVLGPAQQDWLDLRIQSGARRWRLPGLHCLSKTEL
ncbi:hypothetical protein OJAV_G00104290 [Oryzias javanicus]|uniref:Coiled-coil protein 142 C-terminal domain-containing protein n=1 Tax=Oryzias javanicus TaxID=123683 RepID=A0A3S2MV75_ORYJA|nr:hypothetical protein OJAV_G00104290 [Oryzias javanicus]